VTDKTAPFEQTFSKVEQILKDEFEGMCWRKSKDSAPITPEEIVYVSLASFYDNRITCTASHLADVVFSAAEGEVREDGTFIGVDCAVTRVVPVNTAARTLCEGADTHGLDEPFLEHKSDGRTLWLDHGLTELALHYSAERIGHEYFSEIPGDWMFLCVKGTFEPDELGGIFASYLFSLEESQALPFVVERFPELSEDQYLELFPHDEMVRGIGELPLRPLVPLQLGEILDLYLEAAALPSPMFQILGYTRVVEYVSVIVEMALDAETKRVVAEIADVSIRVRLDGLIRRRVRDTSDDALLAQAIGVVCDPVPLASLAPNVVGELRAVTIDNVGERRARALKQLSLVASATRNEAAHAKANYKRTENECPADQYTEFAALMRVVAQQAIHWLAVQPRESWPSLKAPARLVQPKKGTPPREKRNDR
jgi:hypothetical protein